MTAAEAARFELPVQRYVIEGERAEGDTHDPPILMIKDVTEIRAVEAYLRQAGKRKIKTFKRY
jgi:hypothetical protein